MFPSNTAHAMHEGDIAAATTSTTFNGDSEARSARILRFRSKLAQRLSSTPKSRACAVPGELSPPDPKTDNTEMSLSSRAPPNTEPGHKAKHEVLRLVEHLRCAECHNLGQLAGEVTLSSGSLIQRQNNTIYYLRMLIRDASAALESTIESQNQLRRTESSLDNQLGQLTASCPGCVVLSSGITRPVGSQDLTDETQMRQNLTHMASVVGAAKQTAEPDSEGASLMNSIEGWLAKVNDASSREDSQREGLRGELATLEAAVTERQTPFEPRAQSPESQKVPSPQLTGSLQTPRSNPVAVSADITKDADASSPIENKSVSDSESGVPRKQMVMHSAGGVKSEGLFVESGRFRNPPPNWAGR